MNPLKPCLIDRKEIARLLNCSPKQVRTNERRWGLLELRSDLNCKEVRYRRSKVLAMFIARGWIE